MPVRVTEIPGFQGQQINSPAMSGRDPGAQALGSLAQAVANVSDELGAHAQALQKVENGRIISEKRQELAKSYAAFQIDNQKITDPTKRIAKADAFLSSHKAKFDQPGFNPYVRDTLTAHYDDFATRAFISSREDAANLEIKRAGLALQNELGEATRSGDRSLFEAAKATGREAGILLPEQEQALDMDFDRNGQYQSFLLQAEDSPQDALAAVEADDFLTTNPNLNPDDQKRLKKYALDQIEYKRGEDMNLLENALAEGKLTDSEIEAAENLTKRDRQDLHQSLKKAQGEKPITQQEYLDAWDMAANLRTARNNPKLADPEYILLHNETKAAILGLVPPSLQGDLKKELGYLSPAGRDTSTPIKPADRTDLIAVVRGQVSRAFKSNMYGDVSEEATFQNKEAAARKAEDISVAATQFIQSKNPPPTVEEVRAYVDTLNGTAIGEGTPLIPDLPGSFSIGDDRSNGMVLPPKQ